MMMMMMMMMLGGKHRTSTTKFLHRRVPLLGEGREVFLVGSLRPSFLLGRDLVRVLVVHVLDHELHPAELLVG